jgi:FKBP-type peptidyl-prolyl cis-trans isomerase FkpA/FKBP-type peptidyl-prolyl cis-trans isomerase FklB
MHRNGKNTLIGVVCHLLLALAWVQIAAAEETKEETKKEDNILYVLGVAVSQGLSAFGLEGADLEVVLDGIKDGVTGAASHIQPRKYMSQIQALQQEREAAVAAAEKKMSIQFLENAAKESGATKYDSGLVLTTITEGTGPSPVPTDKVKVHYHGTLRSGSVFDSSVERDQPATFPLSGVIPCWTEGLGMMKVGGTSKLVCPAEIAYGDRGRPPSIPGGAALIFEVELLEIVGSQR